MRDLKNIDDAGSGGNGTASKDRSGDIKNAEPEIDEAALAHEQAVKWWDDFASIVECPQASTYDFLKDSFLEKFGLSDVEGIGSFFSHAQKKAIKEIVSLTDPRELSKVISSLESKRLFFDYRTRAGITCARILLDTYIEAKDEYKEDLKKRKSDGSNIPSETEQKEEIQKIVEQKLGEQELAESVEAVAEALTGKDKEEIKKTVEEASRQLRERSSLAKISDDVVGVSRKYLKLDNLVNIGVHVLPLVTWKYRWAMAVVFGTYVSRMAAVHGYKGIKAKLYSGDDELAREETTKALTALKAAGGSILAIGISPLVGKLPAKLAIWGSFAANTVYSKTIGFFEKTFGKKEESLETSDTDLDRDKNTEKGRARRVLDWTKNFLKENKDTLFVLIAKAIKQQKPGQVSEKFEKASKRVLFSKIERVSKGAWGVSVAASKRAKGSLMKAFGIAGAAEDINEEQHDQEHSTDLDQDESIEPNDPADIEEQLADEDINEKEAELGGTKTSEDFNESASELEPDSNEEINDHDSIDDHNAGFNYVENDTSSMIIDEPEPH